MAEKRTDSNGYTIFFAIVMVILVGAILAFVASSLSPKIKENKKFEAQQNILYAMGVNQNEGKDGEGKVEFISSKDVQKIFEEHIKKQLVFQGDEMKEDNEAYYKIDLKKEEQLAKDPNYKRRLPVFVGEKEGETYFIIPMRGKGLWDAIWGYMAIDKDLKVVGVFFDHAGETPGLGANIKERFFMDDFKGEKIVDENGGNFGISVEKGNMDPLNTRKEDQKIDAIAGATITSSGVAAMIKETLEVYAPYLLKLSKEN